MIVYALIDPRNNAVRYVGKSHRSAARRLQRHLSPYYLTGNTHKERWIRFLLRLGLKPEIAVLERCDADAELCEREVHWITHYRKAGAKLTNATDGGEGVSGWKHSPESRAKISVALRGKPKSAEHRRNTGLGQRDRRPTAETRARLSAARRGRYPPPRYGADNNKTKLTAEAVDEIRKLRGVVSQRLLAMRFNVSKTAIRYVQQGRNWSRGEAR